MCRAVPLLASQGATALMMAARNGFPTTVAALLRLGASVDDADPAGKAPLHHAAAHGHPATAEVLLADPQRADVDAVDGADWTPLMHAAAHGHVDVVQTLCARGANVAAQTGNGGTALMAAVRGGHAAAAEALRGFGATVGEGAGRAVQYEVRGELSAATGAAPIAVSVCSRFYYCDVRAVRLLRESGAGLRLVVDFAARGNGLLGRLRGAAASRLWSQAGPEALEGAVLCPLQWSHLVLETATAVDGTLCYAIEEAQLLPPQELWFAYDQGGYAPARIPAIDFT